MKYYYILCVLFVLMGASCKTNEMLVPESTKNIQGAWKITKATRNGADLTTVYDFTRFRIVFQTDNKYIIENPLPFVVNKNGAWAFNDPKYPFKITFTTTGGTPAVTDFDYPVVSGQRNMNFSFSSGCASNTYQYTLEKVTP